MAPAPSTAASIKVVSSFAYRGATKLWSTRFHFTNDAPTTAGRWLVLSDAVTAAQKLCQRSDVTIVGTYGYAAGSEVPVYSKTYSLAGSLSIASIPTAPGDAAALMRFSTADRSSKNHPIYLFNWLHGISLNTLTDGDMIHNTQHTAHGVYAAAWVTGFSDGTITHVRSGPYGHVATGQLVSQTTLHRDFPRG